MAAVLAVVVSCGKSAEQMLVGSWKVTEATQSFTVAADTETTELPGYEDYHYRFDADGLCTVTDRTNEYRYEWFLKDGRVLVLTDYANPAMVYELAELKAESMVLAYRYGYVDGPDRHRVDACQRFALAREH